MRHVINKAKEKAAYEYEYFKHDLRESAAGQLVKVIKTIHQAGRKAFKRRYYVRKRGAKKK